MKPTFFRTPAEFRRWLARHHATAAELLVGFYKKASGKPSITWPESVDEALCFGWIDGIRRSLDAISYTIRFTPRKARSNWSRVNISRARALIAQGRMQPTGLRAYEAGLERGSATYSYEQRSVELEEPYIRPLKKNRAAWSYFQEQPPFYRKTVARWVMSAKREETRLRRIEKLTACSARGQRITELRPRRSVR
jgi:uncharacterized protein YdeI (YjbR/CyaY-like superfamily)